MPVGSADSETRHLGSQSPKLLSTLISGISCWTKDDLDESDYFVRLSSECISEMCHMLARIESKSLPVTSLIPDDYPACYHAAEHLRHLLDAGPHFAIVDRIPVEAMSSEQARALFWVFSSVVARPVAQKLDGTIIYDVRDTGQKATPGSGVRRDKTSSELSYHTDNSYNSSPPEYVALLCFQRARSGGLSRVISFPRIHNEILRLYPRSLERFYRPYWFDRQREHFSSESTVFAAPIFEYDGQKLHTRLSLHQIYGGYQLMQVKMDSETEASLLLLESMFQNTNWGIEFDLRPGWIQYVNNRLVGHSRTSFEDFPEPERKRHLVRLWLRNQGGPGYLG